MLQFISLSSGSSGNCYYFNHNGFGLLIDKGNPNAERLYLHVGFEYANDSSWGGHPMRHLVYRID